MASTLAKASNIDIALARPPPRLKTAAGLGSSQKSSMQRATSKEWMLSRPADVAGVDIVPHLLALIAEDRVLALLEVTANQVAQKSVKLHSGVVGSGETPAA